MRPLRTDSPSRRAPALALAGALLLGAGCGGAAGPAVAAAPAPPARLADTGLYADLAAGRVDPDHLPFSPQYPLWTDGATKRRWIHLPPGSAIDASDPDAWVFPVGTKLWKEFSFGRPVETRYIERVAGGSWIYAAYLWNEEGTDAVLAPERGVMGACESSPGLPYDVPGRADCLVCHEGGRGPVLGFSALQLSSDRDPLAPHAETPPPGAVDLSALVERGLVRGLPRRLVAEPPRIEAATPRERAALGYLHGNCGMCHSSAGQLEHLGLELAYSLDEPRPSVPAAIESCLDRPSGFRVGASSSARLAAGDPDASALVHRMAQRSTSAQMPPLGTRAADAVALDLVRAWVREDLRARRPNPSIPADSKNPSDSRLDR